MNQNDVCIMAPITITARSVSADQPGNIGMRQSFVLTMIGPDHPGIVGRLSAILTEHNAGWLESRMANLAGEFAGILHAVVDQKNYQALLRDLEALQSEGLTLVVKTNNGGSSTTAFRRLEMEVVGTDRAGIVRDITEVLTRFEINVEELATEFSEAPMSSAPLFRATASLNAPRSVDLDAVEHAIDSIAHDLMTELRLHTGE